MAKKTDKIIFVDCFNTIIGRKITPDDVLYNWGKEMNKIYTNLSAINFFRLFKRTWSNLKRYSTIEIENSDFVLNIKDIFKEIYNILHKYNIISNETEENFCRQSFDLYFNEEKKCHFLKENTIKYLNKQKEKGCKIYLVSDFYCSKKTIEEWLKNLGVNTNELFNEIFVSVDLKTSKTTGNIYRKIISMLNLDPKKITMIGDNVYADGIKSKKAKIKHYKFVMPQIKLNCKALRKSKEKKCIPNEFLEIFNSNNNESIYSNYAFSFFLFTKRLAETCERKNIKNLFFLARDGRFMKELFDYYAKSHNLDIKTHYFYVSRKSVITTSCKDFDTTFRSLAEKPFLSCKNFLRTLNFSNAQILKIMEDANIKYKGYHINFYKSKAYKKLINAQLFNKLYYKNNKIQRNRYKNYLDSFGVDLKNEGFYIVDSGWYGNMQLYMKYFFDYDVNIQGYYIGNVNKNSVKEKMYGLLFASKLRGLGYQDKIFAFRRLNYEEFLKTEHGSCKKYNSQNKPILEETQREAEVYYKFYKPLQDIIFLKFKQINQCYDKLFCDIDYICAYMQYLMIKKTKRKDKDLFINLQDAVFDGFAYFEMRYSVVPRCLRRACFSIKDWAFLVSNSRAIHKKRLY